jgi:hypothetical protein
MISDDNMRRLHKDICMAIDTYEFMESDLDFETFKTIIKNYV